MLLSVGVLSVPQEAVGDRIPVLLLGNKIDNEKEREVPRGLGEQLAKVRGEHSRLSGQVGPPGQWSMCPRGRVGTFPGKWPGCYAGTLGTVHLLLVWTYPESQGYEMDLTRLWGVSQIPFLRTQNRESLRGSLFQSLI